MLKNTICVGLWIAAAGLGQHANAQGATSYCGGRLVLDQSYVTSSMAGISPRRECFVQLRNPGPATVN